MLRTTIFYTHHPKHLKSMLPASKCIRMVSLRRFFPTTNLPPGCLSRFLRSTILKIFQQFLPKLFLFIFTSTALFGFKSAPEVPRVPKVNKVRKVPFYSSFSSAPKISLPPKVRFSPRIPSPRLPSRVKRPKLPVRVKPTRFVPLVKRVPPPTRVPPVRQVPKRLF